jgi:hypothetical protein
LEIEPTNDIDVIKKAYRSLAKRHHPDKVFTPEEKRGNTLKFIKIQNAYEEAMRLAPTNFRLINETQPSRESYNWFQWGPNHLKIVVFLLLGVFVAGILVSIGGFIDPLSKYHPAKIAFTVLLTTLLGAFMSLGTLPLWGISYGVSALLTYKMGKRYRKKIELVIMVVLNCLIIYVMFNDALYRLDQFLLFFNAALTIPFLVVIFRINDYIDYRTAMRKGNLARIT